MPWLSSQNDDWLKPDIAQLWVDGNPRLDLLSLELGRSNWVPTELAIHGELVLAHVNNAGKVLCSRGQSGPTTTMSHSTTSPAIDQRSSGSG